MGNKNSRKRVGTLLALLGTVGAAKSNITSADLADLKSSYGETYANLKNGYGKTYYGGDNVEIKNEDRMPDFSEYENLNLDRITSLEQATKISSDCMKALDGLIKGIDKFSGLANSFLSSTKKSIPEAPGFFSRLFKTAYLKTAADGAESTVLSSVQSMRNLVSEIDSFKGKFASFETIKSYTSNVKVDNVNDTFERLGLNFSDLKNDFTSISDKATNASSKSSLSERYDDFADIYKKLSFSSTSVDTIILSALNTTKSDLESLKAEIKKLPDAFKCKGALDKWKIDHERKLLETNFAKEKSLIQDNLRECQKYLSESYAVAWKSIENVDPDISILIRNEFETKFSDLISEITRNIDTISNIKTYTTDNADKINNMKGLSKEFEDKRLNFVSLIENYKNKCFKEKKKLKSAKDNLVKQVNDLMSNLNSSWTVQCSSFRVEDDKNKFIKMAESSYNTAKELCAQLLTETESLKLDISSENPYSVIEDGQKKIDDRRPRVEAAIDSVKEKGLLMRINISKKLIDNLVRDCDETWEKYSNKYAPKFISEKTLVEDSSETWNDICNSYNEETNWQKANLTNIMRSKELSEELANELDSKLSVLSNRIGIFKDKIDNAVLKMSSLINKHQAELQRKYAWQRIFFTTGNYDNIKKEVGKASANITDEDSKKIASVIDSYLAGTYENILTLCNIMKSRMGVSFVLISGAPGWGKTQGVDYLICATNAKKITVSYSDLLRSKDGQKYASDLLLKYRGQDEPLVLVLDEFDTIARSRNKDDQGDAVLINSFFDGVKTFAEDPANNINLRLVVAISNMNKDQMDAANIGRMSNSLVFGSNPDYKRMIDITSEGFECNAAEGSKENFVNNIVRTCESLKNSGYTPNARNIQKAFQAVQAEWCAKMNKGKTPEDRGYYWPWQALLESELICKKIRDLSVRDS